MTLNSERLNVANTALRSLSFCTGAGGLELALHLLTDRFTTVGYVERDSYAAAILLARMEDATLDPAPIWDDVRTFDPAPWRGAVDCVLAGYPCQPFSIAGKGLGDADPRHLWPFIKRHIESLLPWLVILENVPRHLGVGFDAVLADLQRMGYRVEAGLFSAAEVGAPHRRNRLFVVGILGDSESRDWGLPVRREEGTDSESPRAGAAVGDTAGARREEPSRPGISGSSRGGQRSRGRRAELADTTRAGLEGHGLAPALEGDGSGNSDTGAGGSGAVADTDSDGRSHGFQGESVGEPGRGSATDSLHAGEGVADSNGEGLHQHFRQESPRQPDSERSDEELGDAEDLRPVRREGGGRKARGGAQHAGADELAEPEGGGLGVVRQSPGSERLSHGSDSLPHFPPRPDDHDRWARVLERVPQVEPAVCGVVNELAFRHDRLRLTGNGVHPVAAAVAVFSLWTKLVNANG
jgi:DNA (cytosine-5)-methyltransferase 1